MIQAITSGHQWLEENSITTIPLNDPDMPPAGPDFLHLAAQLAENGNQQQFTWYCQHLYNLALYQSWFTMNIGLKTGPAAVKFVPGHAYGAESVGPLEQADVLVLCKMPSPEDVRRGRHISGKAEVVLLDELNKLGINIETINKWYFTSVVKFGHPTPNKTSAINKAWIKDCRPLLAMELRLVRPKYILCLGSEAGKELFDMKGTVKHSAGKVFDYKYYTGSDAEGNYNYNVAKAIVSISPIAAAIKPDVRVQLSSTLRMFSQLIKGEDIGVEEKDLQHIVVDNEEDALHWFDVIYKETETGGALAVDCEWHGAYPEEPGAWLRTIQISHKPKFALCICLYKQDGAEYLIKSTKVKEGLIRLFKSTEIRHIRPVGHFYRADLPWLKHYGVDLTEAFMAPADPDYGWLETKTKGGFDTSVAAHAVNEVDDYKLEVLAARYIGMPRYDGDVLESRKAICKKLKIKESKLKGYGGIPDEILHPYALKDVDATIRLFEYFNGVGSQPGRLDCDEFANNCRMPFWVTMRASTACAEIESTGLLVDLARANTLVDTYKAAYDNIEAQLRAKLHWPNFNINSPHDCRELLFGYEYRRDEKRQRKSPPLTQLCKLTPVKASGKDNKKAWEDLVRSGEAKDRNPSTDKEVLGVLFNTTKDEYSKDILKDMLNMRFIGQVLKTTLKPPNIIQHGDEEDGEEYAYEDGLLSFIRTDGRIHTNVFTTLETGRWASARPNLTNISKRREANYKKILGDKYKHKIRSMFMAAPGHVLIEADYIGAELAIMAWMSGDKLMIEHARRAQLPENDPDYYDIHSNVTVKAFKLNCEPTKKGLESINMAHLRVAAKNVMFGYAYGRGAEAIARQAKEEGVLITVEEAQALIDGLIAQYPELPIFFDKCKKRVHNPKWLCNAFGRYRRFREAIDRKTAGDIERQGQNVLIQGDVADAISRAVDHLYTRRSLYNAHYKIALQIHDALLLEVPIDEIELVYDKVFPECMSQLVPIYPCDLEGYPIGEPRYLGVDREVCIHWGEKISKEEGAKLGIPERFCK